MRAIRPPPQSSALRLCRPGAPPARSTLTATPPVLRAFKPVGSKQSQRGSFGLGRKEIGGDAAQRNVSPLSPTGLLANRLLCLKSELAAKIMASPVDSHPYAHRQKLYGLNVVRERLEASLARRNVDAYNINYLTVARDRLRFSTHDDDTGS